MTKTKVFTKNRIVILIKIVGTITLLLLIISRINFQKSNLSLNDIEIKYLVLAFASSVIFLLTKVFKWHYLLKNQNEYVDFSTALKSLMSGLSLGLITPGHAGEVSRALFTRTQNRIKVAGLVIVDRAFDLLGVFILSILGAFFFNKYLGIFVTTASVGLILLFVYLKKITVILSKIIIRIKYLKKFANDIHSINNLGLNSIAHMIVLSILPFINGVFQFYFLVLAFEKMSLKTAFLTVPIIALVNLIPITIAGIGIREGSAMLLLSRFDVSYMSSVSAAFIQFLMNSALPAILGIIFIPQVRVFKNKPNSI